MSILSMQDSANVNHLPSSSCKARRLLFHGARPYQGAALRKQRRLGLDDMCPHSCIYCDIWKLAGLVYARLPNSPSTPNTSLSSSPSSPAMSSQSLSASSSPKPSEDRYDEELKKLLTSYHHQRSQLDSIISICIVDGADTSPGLRAAHDRCLRAVFALLRQERALERWKEQQQEEEEKKALHQAQNSEWDQEEQFQSPRPWRSEHHSQDQGKVSWRQKSHSHSTQGRDKVRVWWQQPHWQSQGVKQRPKQLPLSSGGHTPDRDDANDANDVDNQNAMNDLTRRLGQCGVGLGVGIEAGKGIGIGNGKGDRRRAGTGSTDSCGSHSGHRGACFSPVICAM